LKRENALPHSTLLSIAAVTISPDGSEGEVSWTQSECSAVIW
jgi:hypothetical protein